jgi:WD40 repeat protein
MIFGHSTEISDLSFSPFRDDILATAAEDSTIKIWKIPPNNTSNLNTPEVALQSHKRRADSIKWNPGL